MKNNVNHYFDELLKNDVSIEEYSDDAFAYRLFFQIHKTVPYVMYFFTGVDEDDNEELLNGEFDWPETAKNIKNKCECDIHSWKGNDIFIGNDWIVFKGTIFNIEPNIPDELSDCIVVTKQDTNNLIFVSVSSKGGFIRKLLPVKEVDIDYNINYNEDFPHKRIEEILTGDSSALILGYGNPGTGNVNLIKFIYYFN